MIFGDLLTIGSREALYYVWHYIPYAIVPILGLVSWHMWLNYIRHAYLASLNFKLLEVRIPQEIWKSPQAMEFILMNALYQTGGVSTWKAKYWDGKVLLWFSLEITSIEGDIHFYIRCPAQYKSLVESQVYSQYPDVEIAEVPDYTEAVPPFTKDNGWEMFGWQYKLAKPDPFPIKTYIDYGMDKQFSLEEEQKIDPLTPLLEYFGSIGKGEQLWMQIITRGVPAKGTSAFSFGRYPSKDHYFQKDSLQELGAQQRAEYIKKEIKALVDSGLVTADKAKDNPIALLTDEKKDVLKSMERNMQKFSFDCGMRILYIAHKDKYSGMQVPNLSVLFRPFSSPFSNTIVPSGAKSAVAFDHPWQDFSGNRFLRKKIDFFKAYKLRQYYYPPFFDTTHQDPFVLSTEELATLYHFPGRVSETPSFKRIDSKKAEAPTDLPI